LDTIIVDGKGRVCIPSSIRRKLGIGKGSKLKVSVEDNKIVLIPEKNNVKFLIRSKPWGKEAFPDAGEALVS